MNIWIVPIEPIETRYTCEWYDYIPKKIKHEAERNNIDATVIVVPGEVVDNDTTEGAFLNFAATNIYKNSQLNYIANAFQTGQIKEGDHFLFTDAWNTGILQLKYMSELLGIPVKISGMWHAGSYDPQDFLGRLIEDKRWTNGTEKAMFHACDYNWFATQFHKDLFYDNVFGSRSEIKKNEFDQKALLTGWPMDYMPGSLSMYKNIKKKDRILFPHRLAPEKQPDIFNDLKESMPEYEFIVCQEQKLTKPKYHKLIAESKIIFSANLQETLGISGYEGICLNVIPMVPDRLSYREMFANTWKYPSAWTESFEHYKNHKHNIMAHIRNFMDNYDVFVPQLDAQKDRLLNQFFSATPMINTILGIN